MPDARIRNPISIDQIINRVESHVVAGVFVLPGRISKTYNYIHGSFPRLIN